MLLDGIDRKLDGNSEEMVESSDISEWELETINDKEECADSAELHLSRFFLPLIVKFKLFT